jgi:hypothetical protein
VITINNCLVINSNKLRSLVRVSWSRDPKQKPKTKNHETPTPLFLQKSYLYCAHVLRLRLLGLVKSFSLDIVTLKNFLKNLIGLKKNFAKF